VIVEIIIEKDGRVSRAKILKGLPFGLSEAAVDAVRTWHFRPGIEKGRAVRTVQNVTIPFSELAK